MDLVYIELDTASAEPGSDDLWVRVDTISAIEAADEGARVLVDGWFMTVQQDVSEILRRCRSALELARG